MTQLKITKLSKAIGTSESLQTIPKHDRRLSKKETKRIMQEEILMHEEEELLRNSRKVLMLVRPNFINLIKVELLRLKRVVNGDEISDTRYLRMKKVSKIQLKSKILKIADHEKKQ